MDASSRHHAYEYVIDTADWVKLEDEARIDGYWNHNGKIYGGNFEDVPVDELDEIQPLDCDAETLEIAIGTGYARDKNHVYYPYQVLAIDTELYGFEIFNGYIVQDADPETIKYIGTELAMDRDRMYIRGKEIPWDLNRLPSSALTKDNIHLP